MTVTIYPSTKFYHGREQYYAAAGGYTILRLTYGSFEGNSGGAIKTATASDYGAEPVHRDWSKLIAAMRLSVLKLGGQAQDVTIEVDSKCRRFGEITLAGTRDDLVGVLHQLAEQMEPLLGRSLENVQDSCSSDMRELYQDFCTVENEPVYLSDGVYLSSDGRMFE